MEREPYIPIEVVKAFSFLRLKTRRKAIDEERQKRKQDKKAAKKLEKQSMKNYDKRTRNSKRMKIMTK